MYYSTGTDFTYLGTYSNSGVTNPAGTMPYLNINLADSETQWNGTKYSGVINAYLTVWRYLNRSDIGGWKYEYVELIFVTLRASDSLGNNHSFGIKVNETLNYTVVKTNDILDLSKPLADFSKVKMPLYSYLDWDRNVGTISVDTSFFQPTFDPTDPFKKLTSTAAFYVQLLSTEQPIPPIPPIPTTTTTTTHIGPTPTTTTTTTTPATLDTPKTRTADLKSVDTIIVTPEGERLGTDSSDSRGTINTINSMALSFGPLAPGETSQTMIIYLKVPSSLAINNIRLALVDCGGLIFSDAKFGIEIQPFIDYNIIPSGEFAGVNETRDSNSIYNVSVTNKEINSSNYVYLNVFIPRNQLFGTGTIRYKWWFDYA